MLSIFIPKEAAEAEQRVAATPETVKRYLKAGLQVSVEAGAGLGSSISDETYQNAGATITNQVEKSWSEADIVLTVTPPVTTAASKASEVGLLKPDSVLIGFLAPYKNLELVRALIKNRVSAFAVELIPRITRAQSMDALSSQANIAGYKAVVLAAGRLAKYFPQLMTAAGTVKPARVVVMGAGVAGLQAVATARRLGAVVEVSDIRPEVKEQVQSLGGKFIDLPGKESGAGEGGYAKEVSREFLQKQQETIASRVALADVVITTALVPGKKAPTLLTEAMVKRMRPGSIIVDLAVEQGGNCELSKIDQEIVEHGVRIIGFSNLPSSLAEDASHLYARNLATFVELLVKDGKLVVDLQDEIIRGSLLTYQGDAHHAPTAERLKGERS
jgi:NAD(P) transhydrogenase subunit alpha